MILDTKDAAYRAGDECEEKESLVTETKLGHKRTEELNLGVCDFSMKDVTVLKRSFI